VGAGVNSLSFFVPPGALGGAGGGTYARFRFNTAAALTFSGPAPDGEVEDYRLFIQPELPPPEGLDFGDAEEPPYRTLFASGGAHHAVYTNFVLGKTIDAEPDGLPSPNFLRDDLTGGPDDEDGVTFTSMPRGGAGAATVVLSSTVGPGLLDAWVDYNQDGIWSPAEQVASSLVLVPGSTVVPIAVPSSAALGRTGSRFRLSSTGGLPPTGFAANGEVEDYLVEICQAVAVPLTNVMFTNIVVTNVTGGQHIMLQWNAAAGVAYQVQRAATLSPPHPIIWTDVGPQIVGPANTVSFTNSPAFERYYRLRVPAVCP
jgi:hypothetical protein